MRNKKRNLEKIIVLLIIALLYVSACDIFTPVPVTPTSISPIATPFSTPTPLPKPTPTSTFTPTPTPTYPSSPIPTPTSTPIEQESPVCETSFVYTIQRDDWLSKISLKYYGVTDNYWGIIECTNRASLVWSPDSFCFISDPDLIITGCSLLIPANEYR